MAKKNKKGKPKGRGGDIGVADATPLEDFLAGMPNFEVGNETDFNALIEALSAYMGGGLSGAEGSGKAGRNGGAGRGGRNGRGVRGGRRNRADGVGEGSGPRPPLGSFDPALEAQRRSGQRGLKDLIEDTRLGRRRSRENLLTELALLLRNANRSGEDITTSRDRGMRDLDTELGRGEEDLGLNEEEILRRYGRTSEDLGIRGTRADEDFARADQELQRNFARQGSQQNQQINATGQLTGGARDAAAQKRATNYQFQFQPLQTANTRVHQDIDLAGQRAAEDRDVGLAGIVRERGRLGQDYGNARSDLGEDASRAFGRLGEDYTTAANQGMRDYGRFFEDTRREISRAQREQGIFESDITAQEYFDAKQRNPKMTFPKTQFLGGGKQSDFGRKTQGKPQGQKKPKKKGK